MRLAICADQRGAHERCSVARFYKTKVTAHFSFAGIRLTSQDRLRSLRIYARTLFLNWSPGNDGQVLLLDQNAGRFSERTFRKFSVYATERQTYCRIFPM